MIPTALCRAVFDDVIEQLQAPTYIVRVHPRQYGYAERVFGYFWRVSVVADDGHTDTSWRIERYDEGRLTSAIFNEGC